MGGEVVNLKRVDVVTMVGMVEVIRGSDRIEMRKAAFQGCFANQSHLFKSVPKIIVD